MLFVTTWMDLADSMLNYMSEKNAILYQLMWRLQTNTQAITKSKFEDIEDRLGIFRGVG